MTDDILARVRALGADFSIEQAMATRAIFAPVAPKPTPELCAVARDCAYGPDARHRLDVFTPTAPGSKRPVVAFVHGGGFVAGEKGDADAPFFNNIGAWAVREGFVGVTVTYRLAPAHPWPAGSDDIAAAVAWLRGNVAEYGGDPDRIVLWGMSAGASHVSGYLAYEAHAATAAASLKGAVLSSGVFDTTRAERNEFNAAYYGADESRYPEMSTLEGLAETPVPLLLTVNELEPWQFQSQAAFAIERRVAAKGRWPAFAWLRGCNHASTVFQIGSPVDRLGPLVADLVNNPDTWI